MLSYALTLAESILLQTWAVPWMPYAAALGVLLLAVAVISKQAWLQLLVALVFLSASAAYSIWVLPVGVMLAGLGLALLIAGAIWRFAHRTPPHVSAGLMWPGAGLLVAPVANIFVVMPVLRMMVHEPCAARGSCGLRSLAVARSCFEHRFHMGGLLRLGRDSRFMAGGPKLDASERPASVVPPDGDADRRRGARRRRGLAHHSEMEVFLMDKVLTAWPLLVLAGLFEVGWAIGLKYTHGYTKLWPSALTVLAMIVSVWLLGLAAKTLPIGTAYAVWVGIGAVGTVALGIVLLDEPASALRLGSIALIIAGIVGLKLATPA